MQHCAAKNTEQEEKVGGLKAEKEKTENKVQRDYKQKEKKEI